MGKGHRESEDNMKETNSNAQNTGSSAPWNAPGQTSGRSFSSSSATKQELNANTSFPLVSPTPSQVAQEQQYNYQHSQLQPPISPQNTSQAQSQSAATDLSTMTGNQANFASYYSQPSPGSSAPTMYPGQQRNWAQASLMPARQSGHVSYINAASAKDPYTDAQSVAAKQTPSSMNTHVPAWSQQQTQSQPSSSLCSPHHQRANLPGAVPQNYPQQQGSQHPYNSAQQQGSGQYVQHGYQRTSPVYVPQQGTQNSNQGYVHHTAFHPSLSSSQSISSGANFTTFVKDGDAKFSKDFQSSGYINQSSIQPQVFGDPYLQPQQKRSRPSGRNQYQPIDNQGIMQSTGEEGSANYLSMLGTPKHQSGSPKQHFFSQLPNRHIPQTAHHSTEKQQGAKTVATTKTTVYSILREEYLRLSRTAGRQDAYRSGRVAVPSFKGLEQALHSVSNINAARVSLLRSRQVMKDTFAPILHLIHPVRPEMYAINCITTSCPLCSHAIALNKLGSYENWCKHLERHGDVGKQIARRFRSIDRNASPIPGIDVTAAQQSAVWSPMPVREDMAPLDEDPRGADPELIPLTTSIHWQALVLNQLLREGVLDATSIMTQEVAVLGSFYFGLVNQRSPEKFGQYPQLQMFQRSLYEAASAAYDIYSGVGLKDHTLSVSHTRGQPVVPTREVVRNYHHYGLSHKSLIRAGRGSKSDVGHGAASAGRALPRQRSWASRRTLSRTKSELSTNSVEIQLSEDSGDSDGAAADLAAPVKSQVRRQSEMEAAAVTADWLARTDSFKLPDEGRAEVGDHQHVEVVDAVQIDEPSSEAEVGHSSMSSGKSPTRGAHIA